MKTGVFYGSTMGTTERIAKKMATALRADATDVATIRARKMAAYDLLIWGTSTWGLGAIQDDWAAFIDQLDTVDLTGKAVAVFGLGDQEMYSDTFVDGMADLGDKAKARGATLIGSWPAEGYRFQESRAVVNGRFVGLALDEENQADLTPKRIRAWIRQLKQERTGACRKTGGRHRGRPSKG